MRDNDETLLCITHYANDLSPCFTAQHFAACENPLTCRGCVPREARNGYLCGVCSGRLSRALTEWDAFLSVFATEARAVQPEPGGGTSKPGAQLPLTPLQLTIDAVQRLRDLAPSAVRLWGDTDYGAVDAVRFTRAVERASRQFPRAESESKIRNSRCPSCGIQALVYEPAAFAGGDAHVRCLSCPNVMDHTRFDLLALIEAQCCRRCRSDDGCTDADCTCHAFSPVPEWERTSKGEFEPYDPTNPDHTALTEAA